jgi:hypothetical protein
MATAEMEEARAVSLATLMEAHPLHTVVEKHED